MKRLLSFYSAFLLLAIFGVSSALATGTAPSQQARYITFSNVQSTSATIGWINGNGAGRMVVAYPGAVTAPAGVASDFSVGTVVGNGTVIYKGTARKVGATDLTPATTYTVKVYEYAADGTIKTDNGTLNPRTVTTPASATPAAVTVLGTFDGLADATGTAYAGGPLVGLKWNQVAGHNDATSWNLTVQKFNGSEFVDVVTYANLDLGTLEDGTPESYIAYLTPGQYQYKVQAVQGTTLGAWSAYSTPFDVTYANVTTNNVADVQSVSNTPVVITINNVFPTIVAEDNILTDAKLTFTGATTTSKIEKVTYAEGSTVLGTITDADGYTLRNGTVYFSDVLQGLGAPAANTQTPLIGHSGKNITWTITISGLDAGTYTAEVTPVAYTLNGTTKENEDNLAAADAFSITMADVTVPAIAPVQTMCGNAVVNFDITYPAIENVDAVVKNNAILKATPALPNGTVVKWSYEGVYAEGKDYTVKPEDQHEISTGVYDYTTIPLSKMTIGSATSTANFVESAEPKTDNWSFTINDKALVAANGYSLSIKNVAQIGTTNYEYNNSTVVIKGLPTTISDIDIAPVATITGTPAVIYENINFNGATLSGYDASVKTDALIHTSTAFPEGAKVVSVKHNIGTGWSGNIINHSGVTTFTLPEGKTDVLLSEITGHTARSLKLQANVIDWEITIVSPVAYTATVDLTPIVYTTAPTFGETPTGCFTAIGEADQFDLAFVDLNKTGNLAQLTPDEQDVTNNKAAFTFDIEYPAITGIGTSVKNNAILECRPAVPNGTVIAWTFEGSQEATYAVNATDDNGTDEGGTFTKIWLSKIVGNSAAELVGHTGTDNWTFEVRGNAEFASKSYELNIANVAYIGETLPTIENDIYVYNTTSASITGVLRVELSDIADVKAIVGTPIILTQTATYQPISDAMNANILTDAILSTTTGNFPAGMSISKITYKDGTYPVQDYSPATPYALTGNSVYLSSILGGASPLKGHSGKTITWEFYITGANAATTVPVKITPVSYVLGAEDAKTEQTTIGNEVEFNVEYAIPTVTVTPASVNTYCGATSEISYNVTYPLMANIDPRVKNNTALTCDKDIPVSAKINWKYNGTAGTPYVVTTTAIPAGTPILLSTITGVRGVDMFTHSGNPYNWKFSVEGLDNATDYVFTLKNIAEIKEIPTVESYSNPFYYKTSTVNVKAIPTVTAQTNITDISTIINTPVIVSANVVYPNLTGLVGTDIKVDEKISTTLQGGFPAGLTITKLVYHNGANEVITDLSSTPYSLGGKESVYLTDILGTPAVPYLSESGSNVTFDVVIESEGLTDVTTIPVTIQTVAYTTKPTQPTDCEKVLGTENFTVVYNKPDFTTATTGNVLEACADGNISFTMYNNYPTITGMNSAVKVTAAITSTETIKAGTVINWTYTASNGTPYPGRDYRVPTDTKTINFYDIVGIASGNLDALSSMTGAAKNETWNFVISNFQTTGTNKLTLSATTVLDGKSYPYASVDLDVTVNALPTLVESDITATNVSACAEDGSENGTITVTEWTGFEYKLDDGEWQSSNEFTGLAAGTYDVVVKNTNGCVSAAYEVTVGTDAAISFLTSKTAPSDYGQPDGKITISAVTGGKAPYKYAITNVNTTTYKTAGPSLEFTGLTEGIYYVKVIDDNGCEKVSDQIIITSVGELSVSNFVPRDATIDNPNNTVVGSADFKLTFNRTVIRGINGFVKIWNAATNPATLIEEIQYNDASRILINANVVTIKHNALPEPGSYYVTIDGSVFRDIANVYFSAITAPVASPLYEGWNFSTPFAAPAAVPSVNRITNSKTSITIGYTKPANVNVLVLAKTGGTGLAHSDGVALTEYDTPSFNTTNAGTDATNALITNVNTLTTGGLTNYVKVYAGTASQVKVTGIAANTWTRFYVITYANNGSDQFNTTVRTLDYKTNRFKDGVEGDNETPTAFGVSAIAPNPVSDVINFTVEAVENSEFTYTVYSMTGETLYTMNQTLTAGSNKVSIATSKLGEIAAGTYLLRIANGSDETMVPFVIVK